MFFIFIFLFFKRQDTSFENYFLTWPNIFFILKIRLIHQEQTRPHQIYFLFDIVQKLKKKKKF